MGEVGRQTRVEAFIDLLERRRKGRLQDRALLL
jgi:hypothetical protein